MQTEVHVYSAAISAGMLLSFFPLLTLMLSLCRYIFKWKAGVNAIYFALDDFFPSTFSQFIQRNFEASVASRGSQAASMVLLFFAATGIFVPLEVALNRIWNCPTNRSYVKNQLLSLGLIFVCAALILLSTTFAALNNQFFTGATGKPVPFGANILGLIFFKLAAVPMSMLMLFMVYWLLPNCKVKPAEILPAAILVGFLLEILKYVNLLTWPYLREKLSLEYGPFVYTVTILLWGFVASMVVLAGAEWAARRAATARGST